MAPSRLQVRLAITLGIANALAAFALVPATFLLVLIVGLGARDQPHAATYMAITFAGGMVVVGLFTWVACRTLRDRRWPFRLQALPIAMLVLLLAWIEVAGRLP